jgi:outer membrane receptor protein involved in Fe transport
MKGLIWFALFTLLCGVTQAQTTIQGTIKDDKTGEPLIGANVIVKESTDGAVTDWDGSFVITTDKEFPIFLDITYIGYRDISLQVESEDPLEIELAADTEILEAVEITGSRISEKQKAAPLTVESLDVIAIKETPSVGFYEGLGSLKGVDLTTASLGFTIINTRGFNSTSPVRSLQLIDGVDNQAPGLNFSLGNFLGASELDVLKVDLIAGASTSFYGPNAFNGVIMMETKDPFYHKGLSAKVKVGERGLFEGSFRWADAIKNKEGVEKFGYKINFMYLRANDWEAENYDPSFQSITDETNPGGIDAVNIYGDEGFGDFRDDGERVAFPGLGVFYRTGYREVDLVDYDTRNLKLGGAVYYKFDETTTLSASVNHGQGTTVYQGDNRFSLKGIKFYQTKLELEKNDKYFIRAYMTTEDAGDSYDAYFTALRLLDNQKSLSTWRNDYSRFWINNISPQVRQLEGYPTGFPGNNPDWFPQQEAVLNANSDQLFMWHNDARSFADQGLNGEPFLTPGTEEFNQEFNRIISTLPTAENAGTRFYDKSDLYHIQGEYIFDPLFGEIRVGGSFRYYTPDSRGTIFQDTMGRVIETWETGFYGGLEKKFVDNKLKLNVTLRIDKHQNFNWQASPAASLVYAPSLDNIFRISFSSAIRNPTLADQFLWYNAGPARLSGNLNGFDSLVTIESLIDFNQGRDPELLEYFDVAPIQPEKVRTIEAGYRGNIANKLWVDANYFFSFYTDFIGFNIGAEHEFDDFTNITTGVQVYRVAANATSRVTTQGFSVGLNYYLDNYIVFSGNYSWNKLNTAGTDDPIIPAFNTPEHKFNIGVSGRNMPVNFGFIRFKKFGFNVNYKWVEGFIFEGSPQFTGPIDTYDLLDAQVNWFFEDLDTTLKIGASNVLNKLQFQTYGGPRIGRLAYISLLYEFKKN